MTMKPSRRTVTSSLAGLGASAAIPISASTRRVDLDVRQAHKPIDRFFDLSVGADYSATTLREGNLAQLETAAQELGFRYLRFHDIFHDNLGTVRLEGGKLVYDWTRIDQLYDRMLRMGVKPFVELGFCPSAMKTSDQTIFYWKGNTSHPRLDLWAQLIGDFARHLLARYGAEEVRTWYFEVWNEPNLEGFWQYADQQAYFALYGVTARSLKSVDAKLRVGGPATAGAGWISEFLAYAHTTNAPVDFVSTHTYGVDYGYLDEEGKMDLQLSRSPDAITGDVRKVRGEIEASPLSGLPLFFSEWSTSYNPRDLSHDSYIAAAYIVSKLKSVQGLAQGMSYWTHSDLFEEPGPPPPAEFHGGFGLMTQHGVRKASWFAYKYLRALAGNEIPSSDKQAWASFDGRSGAALLWDFQSPDQKGKSNGTFFKNIVANRPSLPVELAVKGLSASRYRIEVFRTGFRANDAYSAYLDMGAPNQLTKAQLERLVASTRDKPETVRVEAAPAAGRLSLRVPMRSNDVALVKFTPLS